MMEKLNYFNQQDIKKLGDRLQQKSRVYSPQSDDQNLLAWGEGHLPLQLNGNTMTSVKNFFFPQFESLFAFSSVKGKAAITPIEESAEPLVFWGIRTCDLEAITLLDKVFLSPASLDARYKRKRDRSLFVAFYCNEPYETCFCTSLDYDPMQNQVSDILFYQLAENEYLGKLSSKGIQLLNDADIPLNAADDSQIEKLTIQLEEFKSRFKIKFKIEGELKPLEELFADPYFETAAFKCLECRICTYVCPTCHCFTIEDKATGNEGCRSRCWDSCLSSNFTLMAGGHNPRSKKASRLRQRILHKGHYFYEQHNAPGCVGCGRCIAKCPVSMDIGEGLQHVRK